MIRVRKALGNDVVTLMGRLDALAEIKEKTVAEILAEYVSKELDKLRRISKEAE